MRHDIARMAAALAIGALGGAVFTGLGVPMPWLLGPLLACSLPGLARRDLALPDAVRKCGQVGAGLVIGLMFTPEIAYRAASLWWLMALTSASMLVIAAVVSLGFACASGCDRTTAFFAMMPGGLAELAGYAQPYGGDMSLISLSQSLRIVLIVAFFPAAIGWSMGVDHELIIPDATVMGAVQLVFALIASAVLGWGFSRLGIFNSWLLGALGVGAVFGLVAPDPISAPPVLAMLAQLAIGATLGSRFRWSAVMKSGHRFVPATLLATAVLCAITLVIALFISPLIGFAAAALALAPGGIAEMSLTADYLNLAAPIVTAWQFSRIILIAVCVGPLYRLHRRIFAI